MKSFSPRVMNQVLSMSYASVINNAIDHLPLQSLAVSAGRYGSVKSLGSVVSGLLLASLLTVSGCSDNAAGDQAKDADGKSLAEKEKAPIPVEVVVVDKGDIQLTYRTVTTLEAEQTAEVVARTTGLVESILVEEGDKVKKGQLLAQLDVEQLTLELAQIDATLKKLKNELTRQRSLFDRKLGSSDALDRAKFEYQSQQAQYKLSQLKLNYASIEAPIDGIVTERLIKAGNLIRDNDSLFRLVDLDSLKAVLYLPEKELAKVKPGQPLFLSIDAFPDRLINGTIERIRPIIDTTTGTFKVLAALDNSDHRLQSGMFGKVEVVFDVRTDRLLLPQQAVITQDNHSHVFVVSDNKVTQTPVTLGFKQNGLVEVISGVALNDQVVVSGQQILKDDSKIEVVASQDIAGNPLQIHVKEASVDPQKANENSTVAVTP